MGILREQEAGAKVADLTRKHAISDGTFYHRKAKFGGIDVSDAKWLKQLEDENDKLKKLLAEQMLDVAALRELLSTNSRARRQARSCRALQADMLPAERQAWSIVNADRKMLRYRSCRPPDTKLRDQLRELAKERRRFVYRGLFVLLRRSGEPSGVNRIYRL